MTTKREVESGLGALKVQGSKNEDMYFERIYMKFLSVQYISCEEVRQRVTSTSKKRICFDLTVLTYGFLYKNIQNDMMGITAQ